MEQWEIDLRARLEKELPEGPYQIGPYEKGGFVVHTGKGGKIEFEVAFVKACKKEAYKYNGITRALKESENKEYKKLTQKELEDFLEELSLKVKEK